MSKLGEVSVFCISDTLPILFYFGVERGYIMRQYFFIVGVVTSIFLGLDIFLKEAVLLLLVNQIIFYTGTFQRGGGRYL